MSKTTSVLTWIFAIILIPAGINHIVNPGMYRPLIPDFLPLLATNYFTALVEVCIGTGLLFKKSYRLAAIATLLLMIFFLPFHVVDACRLQPAIGSHFIAWTRLLLQFVLIYCAWLLVPRAR